MLQMDGGWLVVVSVIFKLLLCLWVDCRSTIVENKKYKTKLAWFTTSFTVQAHANNANIYAAIFN